MPDSTLQNFAQRIATAYRIEHNVAFGARVGVGWEALLIALLSSLLTNCPVTPEVFRQRARNARRGWLYRLFHPEASGDRARVKQAIREHKAAKADGRDELVDVLLAEAAIVHDSDLMRARAEALR